MILLHLAVECYNLPRLEAIAKVFTVKPYAFEGGASLAGDQLKPEYLALNPNGVVPTYALPR